MQVLHRLKIWQKIIISLIFPIVILVGSSIWSFQVSHEIHDAAETARHENFRFALLAQSMDKNIVQIQQWLTDISATRGQDGLNDGYDEAEKQYQLFVKGYGEFSKYYRGHNELEQLSKLDDLKRKVDAFYKQGIVMAQGYVRGGPAVGNIIMGDFDAAAEALSEVLVPFREAQVQQAEQQFQKISAMLDSFKTTVSFLAVGAVLLSLLFSYFSINAILSTIRGVKNAVVFADENNDLTQRAEASSSDEIGLTQDAFNHLLQSFSTLILEIKTNSVTLSTSIHELSATTTEMDATADDINKRTDSAAIAMTESTANIKELANAYHAMSDRIADVSDLAKNAESGAQHGQDALSATQTAMSRISSSSKKIVGIMDVLTDISGQTNLLSLNASIEAAKAGEYGKGFAVVAEEVKLLSEKSARFASEIKDLIEVSYANVTEGSKVIKTTGQVLNDIIAQVGDISSQVLLIVDSMHDQERRTIELSQSADEINNVSLSNSVAMNELAATIQQVDFTSNDLQKIAEELQVEVNKFKV